MDNILSPIDMIFEDDINKIVLSNNKDKEYAYKKIIIEKRLDNYQAEKRTDKQVFHETIENIELIKYCKDKLQDGFRQLNAWGANHEYEIKISKRGKIFFSKNERFTEQEEKLTHNRKKKYLLEEGSMIKPLIDMGIFTQDGKIINSMHDKYKQINKFIEIIDDAINKTNLTEINIIDFGCGKSYLTFLVYYYLATVKKIKINMVGLDLKKDVIEKCNATAQKYEYDNLKFEVGDISSYHTEMKVDMVISLHACDTATDYALLSAVRWNAKMIIAVPCCQHELAKQMSSDELAIIERYGIVKERSASLMTDAIRGNLLQVCGYKTQLLEFIDFEQTPKNILIRAIKSNIPQKHKDVVLEETMKLVDCFNLDPTFLRLLKEEQIISFDSNGKKT